jgi:hypothetical protein
VRRAAPGFRDEVPQPDRSRQYDHGSGTHDDADGAFADDAGHAQRTDQDGVGCRLREGCIGERHPKLSDQQQAEIQKMVTKGDKTADTSIKRWTGAQTCDYSTDCANYVALAQ